ncbi:MAG: ATP-grasp domain-containing protein [Ignavibacteriales bacterium]|nr:ATP-grasp domain-containing protein [Ignavibacteriales bacterium]
MKPESSDDNNGDEAEKRQSTFSNTITAAALQPTRANDTYAEWDSEATILAVQAALATRHRVTMVEADEDACQTLLHIQPDIVFNIAEGLRGPSREAQMPAMFEMLDIPYTGSDPLTLGICLDKSRAKEILSHHCVPTAPFAIVRSELDIKTIAFGFPAIVKPLHEGSSKGVLDSSVVRSNDELIVEVRRVLEVYHQPALIEKFLPGREFTVALLGNGAGVRVLPIIEVRFDLLPRGANPIYSYEAKWVWDTLEHPMGEMYTCPAKIDEKLRSQIEKTCRKAFSVLNCRDWCRIDLRLDEEGVPNIIELNPLPGILPNPNDHSAFPMAARAAGLDYTAMLNEVLNAAIERVGLPGKVGR